jgi:phosphoglycerate dehydrogenase-like enzyme
MLGHDPYLPPDRAAGLGIRLVVLSDLLAQADIVSLHAMVTAETRQMIDEAALRRMKPGAILVNTARGALVDEPALARALADGRLGGACLDVFGGEPVVLPYPLLAMPRVIASPHIAAQTAEAQDREVTQTIEDVVRVLEEKDPVHTPAV